MDESEIREKIEDLSINEKFRITKVEDSDNYEKNIKKYDSDKTTGEFVKRAQFHTSPDNLFNLPEILSDFVNEYDLLRNNTMYSVRVKKSDTGELFEMFFNSNTNRPPVIFYRDDMNVAAYIREIDV